MTRIATAIGLILIPTVAAAHPAHGSGENFGVLHFLSDPFHVALTAGVVMAILAIRHAMLGRHSFTRKVK